MGLLPKPAEESPGPKARVAFDAERVTRSLANGRVETVRWEDLERVEILTTDEGPLADDIIWLLIGKEGGCAVPSETDGMDALLARLQRLPGFDNEAVIRAMGCTSHARFVCWKRALE